MRARSRRWFDGVETPFAWYALELDGAALLEGDARPRDEIPDRARDEHLAGLGLGGDPRTDVYGDATDLLLQKLAFARVQSGPNLEPEFAQTVPDCAGAVNRTRRAVEGCEEPVPGRFDLPAPEPSELRSHGLMVSL